MARLFAKFIFYFTETRKITYALFICGDEKFQIIFLGNLFAYFFSGVPMRKSPDRQAPVRALSRAKSGCGFFFFEGGYRLFFPKGLSRSRASFIPGAPFHSKTPFLSGRLSGRASGPGCRPFWAAGLFSKASLPVAASGIAEQPLVSRKVQKAVA
jgi:hypothetical protein